VVQLKCAGSVIDCVEKPIEMLNDHTIVHFGGLRPFRYDKCNPSASGDLHVVGIQPA